MLRGLFLRVLGESMLNAENRSESVFAVFAGYKRLGAI